MRFHLFVRDTARTFSYLCSSLYIALTLCLGVIHVSRCVSMYPFTNLDVETQIAYHSVFFCNSVCLCERLESPFSVVERPFVLRCVYLSVSPFVCSLFWTSRHETFLYVGKCLVFRCARCISVCLHFLITSFNFETQNKHLYVSS